jgi:NADPH:quinone reductase-like Zn-dependent oxidoreductase
MKVYEVQKAGAGIEGLAPTERPEPTPGYGQVLVRIHAASLNYRDLVTLDNPRQKTPLIPLSDGAGEVVAIGEGVARVQVGDRVAGTFFQDWDAGEITAAVHDTALGGALDGVLAEYVVLSERGVVRLPDYLTYEEAATLPCAAVTVWNALVERGGLHAGQSVLLLGTGGVSLFGLQFAKMHGARAIITSSSDEKLTRAREMGADEGVNYRTTPDWEKTVWALTGKRGVDHVVEVGGAGTLEKSLGSTRYGGHVHLIGVLSGFTGQVNPWPIVPKNLRVNGIYVGPRLVFEDMLRAMKQNYTHPVIDRIFPLAEARAAYEYMRSGAHFGKIVVTMG